LKIVSFIFNLGTGNFSKSTLLKLLNQSNYNGAAEEFLKWTLSGGKSLPGLVNRRNAERRLFLTGKLSKFTVLKILKLSLLIEHKKLLP
jgi:lysozyme